MKTNCLVISLLFLCHFLTGQQLEINGSFIKETNKSENLKSNTSKAKIYQISDDFLNNENFTKNSFLNLNLNLEKSYQWDLELTERQVISEDFEVRIATENDEIRMDAFEVYTYYGHIKGNPNSTVFLTMNDGFISGTIDDGKNTVVIEPVSTQLKSVENSFLVYNAKDVNEDKKSTCGADDHDHEVIESKTSTVKNRGCKELTMAIAVDYISYADFDYSIDLTVNSIIAAYNEVNKDYQGAFDNDIVFKLNSFFISTCMDCDRWTDDLNASVFLGDFDVWAASTDFNQSDLAQIWTGRDFEGSVAGISYVSAVCMASPASSAVYNYHSSLWLRRVLVAHELGHSLGCGHDNVSLNTIMRPTLRDVHEWSEKSVTKINSVMSSRACYSDCGAVQTCPMIEGFEHTLKNNNLSFSWAHSSINSFNVRIENVDMNEVVMEKRVNTKSVNFNQIDGCYDYKVVISPVCNTTALEQSFVIESDKTSRIHVQAIMSENCRTQSGQSIHDCVIYMEPLTVGGKIDVTIDGKKYFKNVRVGQSELVIENIQSDGEKGKAVVVETELGNGFACAYAFEYNASNSNCDFYIEETFNDKNIPMGWEVTMEDGQEEERHPFAWTIEDNDRTILNYEVFPSDAGLLTIDGSPMFMIDDDKKIASSHAGTTTITTSAYDISQAELPKLELTYLFHEFTEKGSENDSYFKIEVFDGSNWNQIIFDEDSSCNWSNFWETPCFDFLSINLETYKNSNFKVRFTYADGNAWAGMAAFDNFRITGQSAQGVQIAGCTDPASINYNPNATQDDGSCVYAESCGEVSATITNQADLDTEMVYKDVTLQAKMTADLTTISVSDFVSLDNGFELPLGAELEITIQSCNQ